MNSKSAKGRTETLAITGVYLVVVMSLLDRLVYTAMPQVPWFIVMFLYFFVAKVLGDIVYYRLRPEHRDFGTTVEYLADDVAIMARFAFPITIAQRLAEQSVGLMLGSLMHQLIAGPYIAIAVYLVNRNLREEAADMRYHAGQRLRDLP